MYNLLKELYTSFLIIFVGLGMFIGHFLISPLGKYGQDNMAKGGFIGFIVYNTFFICVWLFKTFFPCSAAISESSLYVKPRLWFIISSTCGVFIVWEVIYEVCNFSFARNCMVAIIPFGCAGIVLFIGILVFCFGVFLVEKDKNEASTLGLTPIREAKKLWITSISLFLLLGIVFLVKHSSTR